MSRRSEEGSPNSAIEPQEFGEAFESSEPLVVMRDIRKSFGPVEVLHGVDLNVQSGEVCALAGENGAGKSTLIKILSGVYGDFSGEMSIGGEPRIFTHPIEAVRAGVATIHQELSLVPSLSVSDNLFLGRETTGRFGFVEFERQESEAVRILRDLELDVSPRSLVEELPLSIQQLLEIGRALARDARVLVFDEPTSALNEHEAGILFNRILALRSEGKAIVYITHKMEEIYMLADRITVLRDGKLVGTALTRELAPRELVRWMVGKDVVTEVEDRHEPCSEPALEVSDLRVVHRERKGRFVVDGISLTLRRGEILGLAGLQGSGISEVMHGLFGSLRTSASGRVRLYGDEFEIRGPRESVQRGLVLLTNDRKTFGLAPDLSVVENASLASLSRYSNRFGWILRKEEYDAVSGLTEEFGLNAPSLDTAVSLLSGGNQQKVYLARWLLTEPKVLLLDEPTRGVDVGAKADVYRLMRDWVGRGMSILLITSEMEELLALSDRILVMHRGKMVAEFSRDSVTKDDVLSASMGQASLAGDAVEDYSR
jgi:ABC-type sugar transport system ATPase subunit